MTIFESSLMAIIVCFCVVFTYKNYSIKTTIKIILIGLILSLGYYPYINQYIVKYINSDSLKPFVLIALIGAFIYLQFFHNKKQD